MFWKLTLLFSDEERVFTTTTLQLTDLFLQLNEDTEISTSYDHEPEFRSMKIEQINKKEFEVLKKHNNEDCNVYINNDEEQESIVNLLNN